MAVLRQSALEDALQAALEEASCAVQWRHELSAIQANRDHAIATINHIEDRLRGYVVGDADWAVSETNQIAAQFVLGCDGHNSHVRRAAGLDFPEIAPAAYYAVFEFRTDCDLANEVRIVLDERTTDVLWPLPDGYCRWSFQLPEFSDTEAEQLKDKLLAAGFGHYPTRRLKDRVPASVEWGNPPALDTGHLRNLIAERAPWFTGSIDALTWRTVVRFEHRLVNTFGRGRLWLAGDAAHLGAPVGVQSMNLGLLEADDLADRVASVIQGERPISELQKYDDHWTGVWRSLHGVSRTVRPTAEADAWVRERADRLVACLPGYGRSAQLLSRQLGLELADSSVTSV
jgi:2-polyprenyl-6-methoxyphenol hydroxylase-like FAD-dependent oxidoreductase